MNLDDGHKNKHLFEFDNQKNSIRLLRKSKLVLFGVFVRRFQFHLERNSLNPSFINFSH